MTNLNKRMWAVAKEYAWHFGEVIGMEPEYWVGDCPDICCFGDTMFFSLEEMRTVIDRLPEYVRRYGSREAVGQEINDWVNWWLEGIHDDISLECILPRVTYQLRPNITLQAWLDGCPRDDRRPWSGPDADFLRLQNDHDTLLRLIREYGPDRELKVVLGDVDIELKKETEAKRERDEKERRHLLKKFQENRLPG